MPVRKTQQIVHDRIEAIAHAKGQNVKAFSQLPRGNNSLLGLNHGTHERLFGYCRWPRLVSSGFEVRHMDIDFRAHFETK